MMAPMRTSLIAPSLAYLTCVTMLTGCGGAPAGGEPGVVGSTVPLDESAPRGVHVTLTFESAETGEEDPPGATVSVRLQDETGSDVRVQLVDTIGHCSAVEPAPGGFASFLCWWAGTGVKLHARAEQGELVIYREDVYEEAPEDASRAVPIRRFALTAGAELDSPEP